MLVSVEAVWIKFSVGCFIWHKELQSEFSLRDFTFSGFPSLDVWSDATNEHFWARFGEVLRTFTARIFYLSRATFLSISNTHSMPSRFLRRCSRSKELVRRDGKDWNEMTCTNLLFEALKLVWIGIEFSFAYTKLCLLFNLKLDLIVRLSDNALNADLMKMISKRQHVWKFKFERFHKNFEKA